MYDDEKKPLGIYVHIPFCVKKCDYCDFVSFPLGKSGDTSHDSRAYIDALIKEIRGYKDKFGCKDTEYEVKTVYIGGGTPSVLAPSFIVRIFDCIREVFDINDKAEMTIEVNPGTVDDEKLKVYREAGINRLSMGLQSADDNELKELGRIHDLADFLRSYESASAAGFDNINVDIMTAIPLQTMDSLKVTLDTVTSLMPQPKHISTYSLILEEGTLFYEKYVTRKMSSCPILPDEDLERAMYHFAVGHLKDHGYERYEISNFAIPGYESRHNSAYWRRRDYLGFGLAASSLVNEVRYRNTIKFNEYLKNPCSNELFEEETVLTQGDRMSEFMFLGLRMAEGVKAGDFAREFDSGITDVYGDEINRLIKDGLLFHDTSDDRYCLTDKGVDYGNYVFSRFV